jgi:hypothetical protein
MKFADGDEHEIPFICNPKERRIYIPVCVTLEKASERHLLRKV